MTNTFGPTYDEEKDGKRIASQMDKIRDYMLEADWRTLKQIESELNYPQSSISAQLRHLRKKQFGGYILEKKRVDGNGTWQYRLLKPKPAEMLF